LFLESVRRFQNIRILQVNGEALFKINFLGSTGVYSLLGVKTIASSFARKKTFCLDTTFCYWKIFLLENKLRTIKKRYFVPLYFFKQRSCQSNIGLTCFCVFCVAKIGLKPASV